MQCLIIDKDLKYIKQLEKNLKIKYPNIIIDAFQEPPKLDTLKKQYDIIFLDILFTQNNGIDYVLVLKQKYDMMTLVFTLSQNDFILNVQEVKPFFIRKNCFDEDFHIFFKLYEEKLQNNLKIKFYLNHTMNNFQGAYITLLANDILYVECFSHELIIHTYKNEYVVRMTLKDFLKKVEKLNCFIQVHRGYAVNMNYVYRVDKDYLYMLDDNSKNEVRISKKYKETFKKLFREFILR